MKRQKTETFCNLMSFPFFYNYLNGKQLGGYKSVKRFLATSGLHFYCIFDTMELLHNNY